MSACLGGQHPLAPISTLHAPMGRNGQAVPVLDCSSATTEAALDLNSGLESDLK